MESLTKEGAKILACAVLEQAFRDYMQGNYSLSYNRHKGVATLSFTEKELRKFCNDSIWFNFLDIDRDYFYNACVEVKHERIKRKKDKRSYRTRT